MFKGRSYSSAWTVIFRDSANNPRASTIQHLVVLDRIGEEDLRETSNFSCSNPDTKN